MALISNWRFIQLRRWDYPTPRLDIWYDTLELEESCSITVSELSNSGYFQMLQANSRAHWRDDYPGKEIQRL